MASSGNLVSAHPGTPSSWQPFPFRSLQRRHVPLPELQAHLECSLRRQHVPLPLNLSPQKETGHRTSCPPRSRSSAVACPLRICAAVNTTNPDFIRCHWESLRTNNSASSQYSTFVTPPRTRSHAASSISGSATGVGGIGDRQEKNQSSCQGRWPRPLDLNMGA